MSINTNVTPDVLTKEVRSGQRRLGILHTPYFEQMPTFETAGCEIVYPDADYENMTGDLSGGNRKLNCQIVFGRDRPSHLFSGYGKSAGQPCASIDIVAGRFSSSNKKKGIFKKKLEPLPRETLVGNNFYTDASRIYISQKCDVDHYFGLPPGDFGRPRGEAGIGIKSDHVRVIGRNSVKIYAGGSRGENLLGGYEMDSNGERLIDSRIEFITNKIDEPQPIILGGNLSEMLEIMLDQLSKLSEAFLLQNANMIKLQTSLAMHFHSGAGVGGIVTFPDPILATGCLTSIPTNVQKISDNISQALNFEIIKMNYLGLPNSDIAKNKVKFEKNILSKSVFTT